jgi:hypothetical protein
VVRHALPASDGLIIENGPKLSEPARERESVLAGLALKRVGQREARITVLDRWRIDCRMIIQSARASCAERINGCSVR